MLLLVTALMTASAVSVVGLIWLTYKNSLFLEQEKRLSETLQLASLLIQDHNEDLADRLLDAITAQRSALKTDLAMFMASLEEQYSHSTRLGTPVKEAQRIALAAATRACTRTGLNIFIFDKQFNGLAHSDSSLVGGSWRELKGAAGANALEYSASIANRDGWDTTVLWWPSTDSRASSKHLACVTTFAPWGWYVGISVDYARIEAQSAQDKHRMLLEMIDSLSRVHLGQSGRIFVMETQGSSFLLSPGGEPRTVLESHESDIRTSLNNARLPVRFAWAGARTEYIAQATYLPEMHWIMGMIMDSAELSVPVVTLATRQALAIGGVFLAGALVAWILTRRITNPILALSSKAARIRPFDGSVPEMAEELHALASQNPGEVGVLAKAWAETLDALAVGVARLKTASKEQDEAASALASSKQELEELNQELESRVSLRTAALEAANERLRHSEARYRSLFMNSPISFLEVDFAALDAFLRSPEMEAVSNLSSLVADKPDFSRDLLRMVTVRDANPAAVEMSGAATKAHMIENLDKFIMPESLINLKNIFATIREGTAARGYEARFSTLDGITRQCIVGLRPLPGHENTLSRVLISILDVTELKEGEALLRTAHEQAQSASKAKSDFLANMSHEIRTPITAILGLAELSQRNRNPAKTNSQLKMIAESARTLLSIIGDVLDLSRVEAGKLTLERKVFDLRQTVQRAVETFLPACTEKGLTLATHLPEELPERLLGDPVRLGQILANLVGNAVKFTQSGGISVQVSETQPNPDEDVELLFCVKDTGIGIPPEYTNAIFDSFRQVDSSFSKPYQGVGLGLAICRELAELMGGKIWVESAPGNGSVFLFTARFKHAPQASAPAAAPEHASFETNGPVKILVAEDNPINRHVFTEFLCSLGHEVTTANDGRQALDMLASSPQDLVFMDVQMPNLDGLEAVRRIRAGECGEEVARIPVVALTAYAMSGDRERFLEAGMTAYLAKPLSLDALQAAVAEFAPRRDAAGTPPATAASEAPPVREACQPLMAEFLAYIRERAAAAEAHLAAGEFDLAAKAGHDVKGTSMAFGAGKVNALGADLEMAAKNENAEAAASAIKELYEELENIDTGG
ncbi:MAG: response regulator [Desulfovibrio sp.]|nr:response regulator [Desulfovibrio sp.]MBI4961397.1 response regulator [Desulfovibrio sp.]